MAKLTLADLANLSNATTAINTINANNDLIETAVENTLSRDGQSPNPMTSQLDMNSNRVINVQDPVAGQDAITLSYLSSLLTSSQNTPTLAQSTLVVYDTRVLAAAATVSTSATMILTLGFNTKGDQGGALYLKGTVSTSGGFQSAGGQWWKLSPNLAQFNVRQFGAIGDGATDDTAAINLAIAAFNTSTKGLLYFPTGTYLCTSALTVITANGAIRGDGIGGIDGTTLAASCITCNSRTVQLMTITNEGLIVSDLAFKNTAVLAPTAGAGVTVVRTGRIAVPGPSAPTVAANTVNFENVAMAGFYKCLDIQCGFAYKIHNCIITNGVLYCVHIRNTVNADEGDWMISDCFFGSNIGTATLVRVDSGGGGKICNCKFNGLELPLTTYNYALEVLYPSTTADFLVSNCSMENYAVGAMRFIGSPTWINLCITNVQANLGTGLGLAINGVLNVTVTGCLFAVAASLTNTTGYFNYCFVNGASIVQTLTSTTTAAPSFQISNDTSDTVQLQTFGSGFTVDTSLQRAGGVLTNRDLVLIANNTTGSGGLYDVIIKAGGISSGAEVARFLHGGNVQFTGAANFTANGSVATVLGSVGATGSRTTVQKWLTIKDSAGNPFYIPCF